MIKLMDTRRESHEGGGAKRESRRGVRNTGKSDNIKGCTRDFSTVQPVSVDINADIYK